MSICWSRVELDPIIQKVLIFRITCSRITKPTIHTSYNVLTLVIRFIHVSHFTARTQLYVLSLDLYCKYIVMVTHIFRAFTLTAQYTIYTLSLLTHKYAIILQRVKNIQILEE